MGHRRPYRECFFSMNSLRLQQSSKHNIYFLLQVIMMQPFDCNMDDDIFKDLFPDGDYSGVINDISFNNCKLHHSEFFLYPKIFLDFSLEDDNTKQFSLPLPFDDTNAESSSTIDGNSSSELNRILPGL